MDSYGAGTGTGAGAGAGAYYHRRSASASPYLDQSLMPSSESPYTMMLPDTYTTTTTSTSTTTTTATTIATGIGGNAQGSELEEEEYPIVSHARRMLHEVGGCPPLHSIDIYYPPPRWDVFSTKYDRTLFFTSYYPSPQKNLLNLLLLLLILNLLLLTPLPPCPPFSFSGIAY